MVGTEGDHDSVKRIVNELHLHMAQACRSENVRMKTVGIRELKARLSDHLKRVRAGARLTVTMRGRPIATIAPVENGADVNWAHALVAEGRARWNGGKPAGTRMRLRVERRAAVAAAVLEDRG